MIRARIEILPAVQRALWPRLAELRDKFVLYGGTALALRLGHRISVDFDFFSSEPVVPGEMLNTLDFLKGAKVLQSVSQTLTVELNPQAPVKLSFFGGLSLGRVGEPEYTQDGAVCVASLLDLAGTKAAVVYQRAEAKDYVDLLALAKGGVSLSHAMAAARALYGEQYNPMLTLKSLTYFGDGNLWTLSEPQKAELLGLAASQSLDLPHLKRIDDRISPATVHPTTRGG